jgi:hypothetical protein
MVAAMPPPKPEPDTKIRHTASQEAEEMRKAMMSIIAATALFGGALVSQSIAGQEIANSMQEQQQLDVSGFGQALTGDNLGEESGRLFTTNIDSIELTAISGNQDATQAGNKIYGWTLTGDNIISDHAFDNMNGFATVIQNSGNQVLIQSDTIVNITVK